MVAYHIEGDADLSVYTPAQLGAPVYLEESPHRRDLYDLIVRDGINQVAVIECGTWHQCRNRVHWMLKAGIDPHDIYGSPRDGVAAATFGRDVLVPLLPLLWHDA
jgi:hypothetical protein